MPAEVPLRRPEPAEGFIRVGQPVSALSWQALSGLANWLRGKGAVLVPHCTPMREVSTAETFRFRVKTRNAAIQRVWLLMVKSADDGGATLTIQAPASGGSSLSASVGTNSSAIIYVENLASQTTTEQQIDISVASAGKSAVVESIACYEQDRPLLQFDTTDYGVDTPTLASGQPIADFDYQSVMGVYNALTNADARRVGLFHWTQGDSTAATQASSTPAALLSLDVPILARKLARSATTGAVKWAAYCRVTAGTGTIRMVTSESGVSDAATVTGTSFAWTTARTVSVDCDDMDATDGRQGSAWDGVNFNLSCTGGSLIVKSISVWSDD